MHGQIYEMYLNFNNDFRLPKIEFRWIGMPFRHPINVVGRFL